MKYIWVIILAVLWLTWTYNTMLFFVGEVGNGFWHLFDFANPFRTWVVVNTFMLFWTSVICFWNSY